jgi:hypothetical protein
MKDAVITVRVPRRTRERVEELARRSLEGSLHGSRVPTLADFRSVRKRLSTSLTGRLGDRGQLRR